MAKYGGIPTRFCLNATANAIMLGQKLNAATFHVGDGGGAYYQPHENMTGLLNEVWSTVLAERGIVEGQNNQVYFKAMLPYNVGGFTIREMCVKDLDGNMLAIANTSDIAAASFEEGIDMDMELGFRIVIDHPQVFNCSVDPNVIQASKADIEKHNTSPTAHMDIRTEMLYTTRLATVVWTDAEIESNYTTIEPAHLQLSNGSHAAAGLQLPNSQVDPACLQLKGE